MKSSAFGGRLALLAILILITTTTPGHARFFTKRGNVLEHDDNTILLSIEQIHQHNERRDPNLHPHKLVFQLNGLVSDAPAYLRLTQNTALLDDNYAHLLGSPDDPIGKPSADPRPENCYYLGTIEGHSGEPGRAAVSTCDGLNGVLVLNDTHRYALHALHPAQDDQGANQPTHLLSRSIQDPTDGSQPTTGDRCGGTPEPPTLPDLILSDPNNDGEAGIAAVARVATNLTSPLRMAPIMLINDYWRYNQYGPGLVERTALDILNAANLMYQHSSLLPNGLQLQLTAAGMYSSVQPNWPAYPSLDAANSITYVDVGTFLPTMCSWFQTQKTAPGSVGSPFRTAFAAHGLSGRQFASVSGPNVTYSGVIGLAYVGTMGGGGANCGVDMATRDGDLITQAETLAHELGHNFGSQHDSTGNACPSGQNVMSPWAGEYFNFSTCSTTYISNWYTSSGQYLPWQAPVVKCGNGILDAGEQCDPGTFNSTGSACCTSSCTLRSNAGCDPSQGGCCDPSTCAMRPMGSPCRGIPQLASSYGTCDLPDVCSGTTPVCPDVQAANGTSCVSPTSGVLGTCIAGSCYSRNDYCVSIVGAGSGYNASCDGLSCRYVVCLTANNTCQPYGYGSQNQSPCNMTGVNKGKKGVCSAGTCVASPVPQMAAASPTFAPYQLPVTATDISSTLPTSTTTTTAANGGQPTTGAFETGGSPVAIGVASGASVIGALGAAAGGLVLWRRYRVRSILAGGASAVVPLSRQSGSMNALNPASRASSAVMLTTVAK